jgi:ABC-2 type transport system ATP-binding protein
MIELEQVTKYFGSYPAITDISFSVDQGEVLGFLGPNGAGKSTTMKIVTGFMPPSSGSVTVAGYDIVSESLSARRHIGYLPETVPLYTEMTVEDYLEFMGRIRGMSRKWLQDRIPEVIDICRLGDYRSSFIGKLSKGFRQRVGIAQSILHDPDILIMDEPTIGIDPIQVVETRQLIKDLGGEHTLIVSTHILPEVSMICERVIIIHEGQIVAVDRPDNLASRLRGVERIELEVRGRRREVEAAIKGVEGVLEVETLPEDEDDGGTTFRVDARHGVDVRAQIASAVVRNDWDLLRLEALGMTLEEIFLRLTTEEVHA